MKPTLTRRHVLAALAASAAAMHPALAQETLALDEFGLRPNATGDQTAALTAACAAAAQSGRPLFLPSGLYLVGQVELPDGLLLQGIPGSSVLQVTDGGLAVIGRRGVTLEGLTIDGSHSIGSPLGALLRIDDSTDVRIRGCTLSGSRGHGISGESSEMEIVACAIRDCDESAVFSLDGRGVKVTGCRISGCGNGGVLVWRSAGGRDGAIVSGNSISAIDNRSGGNGQYGNGINIYRADEVIVSGNHIADVQFSAIRLNSTNDTVVSGNLCIDCQEVAIFSEFAFSGSVIADNIVDRAAQGISITNFNEGGRLATCSGNVVRNIFPSSDVNPDTVPVGIAAEADAVISGNVVEVVPGIGIMAGWGPYLRDVMVSNNIVRDVETGIAVSLAEGAGRVVVTGNLVAQARRSGIAGFAWSEMVSDDLVRDAGRFPTVSIAGNSVG